MKLTSALIATTTLISGLTLAAPQQAVSQMAAAPQWTITNMKRVCANGTCTWNFGIKTPDATTPCTFKVKGAPATQTDSAGHVCGAYTVSTGWSDQFGAQNGFTTLAVVNGAKKQIIYPAYTDKQLGVAGKVVKPDQSYAPANLPQ